MPYVRRLSHEGESLTIGGLIRLTFRKKDGKRHVIIDAPPGVKITATGPEGEDGQPDTGPWPDLPDS